VQDNSGTTRVYAPDVAGNLEEFYSASGTTTWTEDSRGGTWPDDATSSVGSGGVLKVFAIGTTTNMYYDQLPPGGSWSGWVSVAGTLTQFRVVKGLVIKSREPRSRRSRPDAGTLGAAVQMMGNLADAARWQVRWRF
jgi:hypothetical protein